VKLCKELGVVQSMGAVGTSADNAPAESFNAALKREVLQDNSCWVDAATCRRQVFQRLVRYTKRRHSFCKYLSPHQLRKDPDTRYAARSRITTNPVPTAWGQGPRRDQEHPVIAEVAPDERIAIQRRGLRLPVRCPPTPL
jgi:hypothetical protein